MEFYSVEPTLENYWRAIILFGKNSASYKFALAKALLKEAHRSDDLVTLDSLALPFAIEVCQHLALADKQGTHPQSKFLEACRSYNEKQINESSLHSATLSHGFVNVIDAFHNVNNQELDVRFFRGFFVPARNPR
jgi:hypothetical protein